MIRCPFYDCEVETTIPEDSLVHMVVAIGHDDRAYIHAPYDTDRGKLWIMRMLVEVARVAGISLQEIAEQERRILGTKPHLPRGATVQ